MEICFNEERAEKVFRILDDFYRQKKGLYKNVVLPQDARPLPSDNPAEIGNWFFFAAHFMRGGVVNDTQFNFFRHLFKEFPEFFDPTEIYENWLPARISEQALRFVAGKIKTPVYRRGIHANGKSAAGVLGFKMGEHLRHLHHNAGILKHCWGNNVLNVYAGVKDFEEAFARIDYRRCQAGFLGMRRKVFSLLTIWLQEADLIARFPAPIPVDFHAMRIFLQTGLIENGGIAPIGENSSYPFLAGKLGRRVTESFVDSIAIWTQGFLAKIGISHMVINPACWILGRELCAGHFQARPISGEADKYIDPALLEENSALWPVRYNNPCAFCPIEQFCEAVIPSMPYYHWGLLVKIRRIPYSNREPFLPGMQDLILPPLAKSRKKIINAAR